MMNECSSTGTLVALPLGINREGRFGLYCSSLSLCIYLVFVFFGTSLPFQERPAEIGDIVRSNAVNQWGYSILYLLSLLGLVGKFDKAVDFVKREKWLSLFLLWAFLSVAWSEYSFISFKRWIQIAGSVLILVSFMANVRDDRQALNIFKIVLGSYLVVSAVSIAFIPEAVHGDGLGWKGLAPHKNVFGQACLVSTIVWGGSFVTAGRTRQRLISLVFIILSMLLLIGSKSVTSLVVLLALVGFLALVKVCRTVLQPMVGHAVSWGLLGTILSLYTLFLLAFPEVLSQLFNYFDKDLTLTGRTDLWARVFESTYDKLPLGWGYGGFWVVDSPWINRLYFDFPWFPNQAHMGYLDIINETGLVGGGIFLIMIISYCVKLSKPLNEYRWTLFFVASLILNLTESSLFRTNTISGTIFLFAYVTLFFNSRHQPTDRQHFSAEMREGEGRQARVPEGV